ncbi:hypothetical protein JOD43_000261 [Pullulanibacillus pueri]|nr:hypothetical protein [Pullulanibacillus pueri]
MLEVEGNCDVTDWVTFMLISVPGCSLSAGTASANLEMDYLFFQVDLRLVLFPQESRTLHSDQLDSIDAFYVGLRSRSLAFHGHGELLLVCPLI